MKPPCRATSFNFRSAQAVVVGFALGLPLCGWAARLHEQPPPALDRSAAARDAAAAGIGRTVASPPITTIDGVATSFDQLLKGRRALVVAMTSAECPIARKYAPRIAAMEAAFDGKIAFLYVNPVDAELTETIRLANRNSGIRGPYATDHLGILRRELKPSTTTEVFVLDASRKLVYRGAVDDQFRVGGAAKTAQRSLLKDALDAVLAGKSPAVQATAAPGCLVDMPRDAASAKPATTAPHDANAKPKYYPDIAKIVESNCTECHRVGGKAPFTLESPNAIEGRAAMIAAVVREGLMPPTHGLRAGSNGSPVLDRTMREEDREALIAWLQSQRELGGPPPAEKRPDPPNTWTIGVPDLILTTPGPTLPTDGPLQYGRYLVPVNLDTDRWVEAIECRTVMHDSVDHGLIWIIPPGGIVPGAGVMPPAPELFASYSRSDALRTFPPGSARKLAAGSLIVADLFARPMGKPTIAQLRIALKFAEAPPSREVKSMLVSAAHFELPAEKSDSIIEAATTLTAPTRLIALQPYMGPRGRELIVEAHAPGAPARTLLSLDRYDWRWQIRYVLREPLTLPANTRLVVRGVFDNSADNLANPDPSRMVPMGMGTEKEAMVVGVEYETP